MENSLIFICEACGKSEEYDPASRGEALPKDWRMRLIESDRYLLCSACGHDAHFIGGISPLLSNLLYGKKESK